MDPRKREALVRCESDKRTEVILQSGLKYKAKELYREKKLDDPIVRGCFRKLLSFDREREQREVWKIKNIFCVVERISFNNKIIQ